MVRGAQYFHKTTFLHTAVVVVVGTTDWERFGFAELKSLDAILLEYGVAVVHADDVEIGVLANCGLRRASSFGSQRPSLIRLIVVAVGMSGMMLEGWR